MKTLVTLFALLLLCSLAQSRINNLVISLEEDAQTSAPRGAIIDSQDAKASLGARVYQWQTIQTVSDTMDKYAYERKIAVDRYTLATTVFNSQAYLGDFCSRCKSLKYFAFRTTSSAYLTANSAGCTFVAAGSNGPSNQQLFIGEQQIDGTWAFKSLTQQKYIRAHNDNLTINWQTYVGPWERWYIERHGNHVHIQSGQFANNYWTTGGGILGQMTGGASSIIVEHWPDINWGWNW